MPRINVLDKHIAELIAAGEVVERPASVVKELVENSIDAGADSITVEIKGGGISYIRISDNGCGILKEDIPKAFLRHATSKIKDQNDLDAIFTLGFRGEALASISAVAKIELITKTATETEGTSYKIEGGEFAEENPAGVPDGTTIIVKDIFYNTPARMKFLKKDVTEGTAVASVIDKCALAHPEISFTFIREGSLKLKTTGGGDLQSVIREIYGKDFSESLFKIDYNYEDSIKVTGYISKPSAVKSSRQYQNFFINNRYIKTRTCMAALEEAFKNKIMSGKFPACVINLDINPAAVDVNVHPAKIEVRFEDEKPVFKAVYIAVKNALNKDELPIAGIKADDLESPGTLSYSGGAKQPKRITAEEFKTLFAETKTPQYAGSASSFNRRLDFSSGRRNIDIFVEDIYKTVKEKKDEPPVSCKEDENPQGLEEKPAEAAEIPPIFKKVYSYAGELFKTYIVLESGEEVLLVDKHAAHERLIYKEIKENLDLGDRQILLSPVTVTLAREEYAAACQNKDKFLQLGFVIDEFGDNTIVVREIPAMITQKDIVSLVSETAAGILKGKMDFTPNTIDRLLYSIACRSAVKGGDLNHEEELKKIIESLAENPDITHCPHGRPVYIKFTKNEIEKMFGRLG